MLAALAQANIEVQAPQAYGLDPVLAVHDADYVAFLEGCWQAWQAAGHEGEAIPNIWPARTLRGDRIPSSVSGQLGYYALAAETSISEGTFAAAMASKDTALAAVEHTLATGEPSFGLCRPPGHHAAFDQFGGYCFFNNAAIAAQRARPAACIAWPCWTWTFITATVPSRFSTSVTMCCSLPCMATPT